MSGVVFHGQKHACFVELSTLNLTDKQKMLCFSHIHKFEVYWAQVVQFGGHLEAGGHQFGPVKMAG